MHTLWNHVSWDTKYRINIQKAENLSRCCYSEYMHTPLTTDAAPALCPNIVTRSGLPPKFAMLSWTHVRAMRWSRIPNQHNVSQRRKQWEINNTMYAKGSGVPIRRLDYNTYRICFYAGIRQTIYPCHRIKHSYLSCARVEKKAYTDIPYHIGRVCPPSPGIQVRPIDTVSSPQRHSAMMQDMPHSAPGRRCRRHGMRLFADKHKMQRCI